MPPPASFPSRKAILLVAVVQREQSLLIKHATSPNHSPQHPAVLSAHASLSNAPEFIFPTYLSSRRPSPHSPRPVHTVRDHNLSPQHLPLSSSAAYLALAEPASHSVASSLKLPRPSKSSFSSSFRTFSNLSSSNTNVSRTTFVLRRPTSSPPPRLSSIASSTPDPPANPSCPSTVLYNSAASNDMSCRSSVESRCRKFRTVLRSATSHVFAITAQDGSRQYAFCRPLSSSHAVVVVSFLPHTAPYVSALEHTAATYAFLLEDARASPIPHAYAYQGNSASSCVCSSFLADNIMRCSRDVAKKLTHTLLACVNDCSLPSCEELASGDFASPQSSPFFLTSSKTQQVADGRHRATDGDDSTPCLSLSTASSGLSGHDIRIPDENSYRRDEPCSWEQPDICSNRLKEAQTSHGETTPAHYRVAGLLPWELTREAPRSKALSVERSIELADAALLLRHFSVRQLTSIVVALLEERRICFVGPNTAIVSRAVLALDNLVRPFKWPHLISPILLAHILPVLGAPFPYLVGILEEHFPATKELPLENVVFADISSGKVTTIECPGELHRHIPRRIRSRLERRLARAKIACTRTLLRSRSTFFPTAAGNSSAGTTDADYREEFLRKDKPSLMKRSRSSSKVNEAASLYHWLDRDTSVAVDKTMRKFFSELLDSLADAQDSNNNKADLDPKLDGVNSLLPHSSSSTGTSLVSSKRDSERRPLAKLFQRTQMFMQWQDEPSHDSSFGTGAAEAEQVRGKISRKRSKDRDSSMDLKKLTTNSEKDFQTKGLKSKIRLPNDMDGILSGDDGLIGENGAVRKRFRSKGKLGRRQGVRLQFSDDVGKDDVSLYGVISSADEGLPQQRDLHSSTSVNEPTNHITKLQPEVDMESEAASRRSWLPIRLPASPWTLAREWATQSERESGTESETCEHYDEGEETDPFDQPNEEVNITDMFPAENVGIGWTRVRHWNRKKNKLAGRV